MARILAEESAQLIEDGTYEVECINADYDTLENPQFGDGEVCRFNFEVVGVANADGEPVTLDPIANWKLTPKSKLWEWATALGVPPSIGQEFETEELVGKHAMAKVVAKLLPDGTRGYPRIESLMAMPKQAPRRPHQNGAGRAQESRQPSQSASVAEQPADAELERWWKKVIGAGLTRKEVIDQSQFAYERDPWDLTAEERESVFEMVAGK